MNDDLKLAIERVLATWAVEESEPASQLNRIAELELTDAVYSLLRAEAMEAIREAKLKGWEWLAPSVAVKFTPIGVEAAFLEVEKYVKDAVTSGTAVVVGGFHVASEALALRVGSRLGRAARAAIRCEVPRYKAVEDKYKS